ncbi:MAG: stage III sporulation protein AC [Clostridia bacterium]|nr:stage III sporulation protein AC [Clostridia bacterium]
MQIELLFQIAGVGVLTTVVAAILQRSGRDELATLSTVAGLAIVLLMVVGLLADLFTSVRTIFQLY